MTLQAQSRVFVAGGTGMVGSAVLRRLRKDGFTNLLAPSSLELDLTDQVAVRGFFDAERPEYVFLAAAVVGGIHANNTYPADFITSNLEIQMNVIQSSFATEVKKLLFLGSSCIYPRDAPQPIKEECLLSGPLEPTNEAYAVAKIAGIKLCEAFNRQFGTNYISAMPTNLYGPNDNYDPLNSHVLPALIRRFHEAAQAGDEEVVVWGTGRPRREFLYVDDLADACLFLMNHYDGPGIINVGCGEDQTIAELANVVKEVVDFRGRVRFDPSKPDGTPRKLLDLEKLHTLGWRHQTPLREGIAKACEDYLRTGGRTPRVGVDTVGGSLQSRAEAGTLPRP